MKFGNILMEMRGIVSVYNQYPSSPKNIGLNNIPIFMKKYPDTIIGLSDHSGEISHLLPYMLGARFLRFMWLGQKNVWS